MAVEPALESQQITQSLVKKRTLIPWWKRVTIPSRKRLRSARNPHPTQVLNAEGAFNHVHTEVRSSVTAKKRRRRRRSRKKKPQASPDNVQPRKGTKKDGKVKGDGPAPVHEAEGSGSKASRAKRQRQRRRKRDALLQQRVVYLVQKRLTEAACSDSNNQPVPLLPLPPHREASPQQRNVMIHEQSLPPPPPLPSLPPLSWPPVQSVGTKSSDTINSLPYFSGPSLSDSNVLGQSPIECRPQLLSTNTHLTRPTYPLSHLPDPLPPLRDNYSLMNRGLPFEHVTYSQSSGSGFIGCRVQHHPEAISLGSILTSMNPDLNLTQPSMNSRPISPSTPRAVMPPPTRTSQAPQSACQLKISSLLSPKRQLSDSGIGLSEARHQVGPKFTLGKGSGYGNALPVSDYPPPIPSPSSDELKGHAASSRLRNKESVFSRLDSPTKFRQSRLQFSRVPKDNTYTEPQQGSCHDRMDVYSCECHSLHSHDDVFHRPAPRSLRSSPHHEQQPYLSSGSSNHQALTSSSQGAIHGTLPPLNEPDQRKPYLHSEGPSNSITVKIEPGVQSKPIEGSSNSVLVKLEPGVKSETNDSPSCLYQSKQGPLNVTKLLKRYAPNWYKTDCRDSRPSTSHAHRSYDHDKDGFMSLKCSQPTTSTQERIIDIEDSTMRIQIPGSSRASASPNLHASPRLPLDYDIDHSQDYDTPNRGGAAHHASYFGESVHTHIPIPLSRMGLKVVAIDCEMVGCLRKEQPPPEHLLANNMRRYGGRGASTQLTMGLGGVLSKTRMKPQPPPKRGKKKQKPCELSIAARCSIIAYDGVILYDKYIDPTAGTDYKIIRFRTPWSGIKPSHMIGATPFNTARQEVLNILGGCIVIGHNISTDLRALEIDNIPASRIRDTSFHPTLKLRAGLPMNKQAGGLKKMTLALLGRKIQTKSRVGHCSVEDATATMDLYKLVELEWEV